MEYLILIYASGIVTTIIGIADLPTAQKAFAEACEKNAAQWAYLYKGDGTVIDSFGC